MGYYMRFMVTSEQPVNLDDARQGLHALDHLYEIEMDRIEPQRGHLYYEDQLLGEIEINTPDDDIFDEDIEELVALVSHSPHPSSKHVIDTLERTNYIVAVSALWQGKNAEPTLEKLDVLWDWLFEHYDGILQADNDGFYNQDGLILGMSLKI